MNQRLPTNVFGTVFSMIKVERFFVRKSILPRSVLHNLDSVLVRYCMLKSVLFVAQETLSFMVSLSRSILLGDSTRSRLCVFIRNICVIQLHPQIIHTDVILTRFGVSKDRNPRHVLLQLVGEGQPFPPRSVLDGLWLGPQWIQPRIVRLTFSKQAWINVLFSPFSRHLRLFVFIQIMIIISPLRPIKPPRPPLQLQLLLLLNLLLLSLLLPRLLLNRPQQQLPLHSISTLLNYGISPPNIYLLKDNLVILLRLRCFVLVGVYHGVEEGLVGGVVFGVLYGWPLLW